RTLSTQAAGLGRFCGGGEGRGVSNVLHRDRGRGHTKPESEPSTTDYSIPESPSAGILAVCTKDDGPRVSPRRTRTAHPAGDSGLRGWAAPFGAWASRRRTTAAPATTWTSGRSVPWRRQSSSRIAWHCLTVMGPPP